MVASSDAPMALFSFHFTDEWRRDRSVPAGAEPWIANFAGITDVNELFDSLTAFFLILSVDDEYQAPAIDGLASRVELHGSISRSLGSGGRLLSAVRVAQISFSSPMEILILVSGALAYKLPQAVQSWASAYERVNRARAAHSESELMIAKNELERQVVRTLSDNLRYSYGPGYDNRDPTIKSATNDMIIRAARALSSADRIGPPESRK